MKSTKNQENQLTLERRVIGAMIREGADIASLVSFLRPDDFIHKPHREIVANIFSMHRSGEYIDITTVAEKIEKPSILAECEPASYSTAQLQAHAELLKDKANRRNLLEDLDTYSKALGEGAETAEVIEQLQQRLFDLSTQEDGRERFLYQATVEDFQKSQGISLGFHDLNWLKIDRGDMVVVGGRPSMGKTALCLKVAINVALSKIPVLVYSLEMSFRQIVQRLSSMNQKVPLVEIRNGGHERDEFEKTLSAPIIVDDCGSLTTEQLRSRARKAIQRHKVGLVVIDYMQLMSSHEEMGEYERITEISKGIKRTAKDLNVPIIVACQLNRVLEAKGEDKRPSMAHLRGSGAIEQDADVIIFPYRPHVYDKKKHGSTEAEIIIAKNRNGSTGDVSVVWLDQFALFESMIPEGGNQ